MTEQKLIAYKQVNYLKTISLVLPKWSKLAWAWNRIYFVPLPKIRLQKVKIFIYLSYSTQIINLCKPK